MERCWGILGLIGIFASLIVQSTPRKGAISLVFVIALVFLRTVYLTTDVTPVQLLVAFITTTTYVMTALESAQTTGTFLAGLLVFTVVSTVDSGSYVPTVVLSAPALLGLIVLYLVKAVIGGTAKWAGKN